MTNTEDYILIITLPPVSSVVPRCWSNSHLTMWWVRCQEVCSRKIRRPLDRRCQLCSAPRRLPHPFCSSLRPRSAALVSSHRKSSCAHTNAKYRQTPVTWPACFFFVVVQPVQRSTQVEEQQTPEVKGQTGLSKKRKKSQKEKSEAEQQLESR